MNHIQSHDILELMTEYLQAGKFTTFFWHGRKIWSAHCTSYGEIAG